MWVFFIFSAGGCALRFRVLLGILAGACTAGTGSTEGAGGMAGSIGAAATVATGTGSVGVASLCWVGLSLAWISHTVFAQWRLVARTLTIFFWDILGRGVSGTRSELGFVLCCGGQQRVISVGLG